MDGGKTILESGKNLDEMDQNEVQPKLTEVGLSETHFVLFALRPNKNFVVVPVCDRPPPGGATQNILLTKKKLNNIKSSKCPLNLVIVHHKLACFGENGTVIPSSQLNFEVQSSSSCKVYGYRYSRQMLHTKFILKIKYFSYLPTHL